MALTVEEIQESIFELVESSFIQPVYEVAVPDSFSLERDQMGEVIDYIAIQFGDMQITDRGSTSFVGPRYDDYQLPFYTQAVSANARTARRLANKMNNIMLGSDHPFSTNVRKRFGGGVWPVIGSNQATEAYLFPTSFGVVFQAEVANQ